MNTPGTPSGPRSREMANGAATLKTDHVAVGAPNANGEDTGVHAMAFALAVESC